MCKKPRMLVLTALAALLASTTVTAQDVKNASRPDGSLKGSSLKQVVGPDAFGYMGYDSSEPQCTHDFIDISGTGALVVSGDDATAAFNLPGAAFEFYGVAYNQLWATTNGVISTQGGAGLDFGNDCPLPQTPSSGGGGRIYPLHDDLISDVYFEYFPVCPRESGWGAPEPCSIIQWANVTHFGWDDDFDFQAILYETSQSIVFQHDANNPENGAESTTAIQNVAATDALTFACNTPDSILANTSQCIYNPSFPAGLAGQGQATFEVNKVFTDGNPGDVDVTLNCFTGLPLVQSQTISESQNVKFIVESFASGELDCDVTETDVTGYTASYNNGSVDSADSCEYDDVLVGQANVCTITNSPTPVEVSVFKDWIIDGQGGDTIDAYYRLTLACHGVIVDGFTHGPSGIWRKSLYDGSYLGTADAEFNADVVPDWDGGTACWVLETVYDSAVEVSNGCGSNGNEGLLVELAGGDSCTITNTVFFEGIPTLSQYGLAILALLMLGVGFVGFRRFV